MKLNFELGREHRREKDKFEESFIYYSNRFLSLNGLINFSPFYILSEVSVSQPTKQKGKN